jgi:hypothetical protein
MCEENTWEFFFTPETPGGGAEMQAGSYVCLSPSLRDFRQPRNLVPVVGQVRILFDFLIRFRRRILCVSEYWIDPKVSSVHERITNTGQTAFLIKMKTNTNSMRNSQKGSDGRTTISGSKFFLMEVFSGVDA